MLILPFDADLRVTDDALLSSGISILNVSCELSKN